MDAKELSSIYLGLIDVELKASEIGYGVVFEQLSAIRAGVGELLLTIVKRAGVGQ